MSKETRKYNAGDDFMKSAVRGEGMAAGMALAGVVIGSVFLPGVGTVLGAKIGGAVGAGVSGRRR